MNEKLDDLVLERSDTLSTPDDRTNVEHEIDGWGENPIDLLDATHTSEGRMKTATRDPHYQPPSLNSLPTELLLKIFLDTIKQRVQARRVLVSKGRRFRLDVTPVLLAQVCTLWRQIFSFNTSLWEPHPSS
jgi:hypothetical protein